jgi:hypothetical protein
MIGRKKQSTGRKSVPIPLCPPQIPYDLTRDRTWAAAVGSQRLTNHLCYDTAIAQRYFYLYLYCKGGEVKTEALF